MLWLVDLIGFNDEEQKEILYFAFKKKKNSKISPKTEGSKENIELFRICREDLFYRICVKFDLPIFEELVVSVHSKFKLLPLNIQQYYCKILGANEFLEIKEKLIAEYSKNE